MLVVPLVHSFSWPRYCRHHQRLEIIIFGWPESGLLPRCPANKLPFNLSSQRQHSLQDDLDGKILESSLEMGRKVGTLWLSMMQRWWKHIQFAHSAPNPDTYLAMTGNLLPVCSFEIIKKRHLAGQGFRYRNDILGLGKQEDWHSRICLFLHVLSPHLPLCWRRYRDPKTIYPKLISLDTFQVLMLTSFKHYRPHLQEILGKNRQLLMARKHQDLSQPHRTCATCFRFLK